MLIPVMAGAVLGALFVLLARWRERPGELRVLALGLLVAALIYVGLALPTAGWWLGIEAAGVAVFGLLAWLGMRAAGWLAFGWVAHVGWDVGLHLDRAQPVVGSWYPLLCVGFDLVVAGFLLSAAIRPATSRAEAA